MDKNKWMRVGIMAIALGAAMVSRPSAARADGCSDGCAGNQSIICNSEGPEQMCDTVGFDLGCFLVDQPWCIGWPSGT